MYVNNNHKLIGIIYIMTSIIIGMISYTGSNIIRLELSNINNIIISLVNINYYNINITIHGIIMIFYLVIPYFINGLGNILIVIIIGNNDVSYPRCNNISIIIYIITYKFIISNICIEYNNGVGWTIYPPLSSILNTLSNIEIYSLINSLIGLGISSSYTFINMIITIINNKVEGYNYNIIIVYVYSILIVSILLCLVLPILSICLVMLLLDIYSNSIYYDILYGGDSILYQHLFWLFGHPEVYILIIPSFGVINYYIISIVYKLYSSISIIYCIISISIIGLLVWCHHMFIIGLDNDTKGYFSCITMIISLPTGCKLLNWLISIISNISMIIIYNLCFSYSMLILVNYIVLFIVGGVSGIIVGNIIIDICLHDTFYIIIHFHIVLSLSILLSLLLFIYIYIIRIVFYYIVYYYCIIISYVVCYLYIMYSYLFIMVSLCYILLCMLFIGYNLMPRRVVEYYIYINCFNYIILVGILLFNVIVLL